jgi:molybdopterin molybdotransferase
LRRRGEVFRRGEPLLAASSRLTPGAILLAATVGAEPLPVFRRPRCSVAATGSEIVPAAAVPGPGQIRNGNGPALLAALARRGIDAEELAPVPDRREDLAAFFAGLGSGRELLVTTGGVSAGDFDHTSKSAEESGFEILFHGVAVKPGKPVAFGKRGGVFWLGLPGNPVSALVTFEVFGGEVIARMEGRLQGGARVQARLRSGTVERGSREAFRDCALSLQEGILLAEPIASRGSHDILAQARRNALMHLAAGGGRWEEGTLVECVSLGTFPE